MVFRTFATEKHAFVCVPVYVCMYVCMYVWTSAWLIVGTLKQRLGLVLLLWQHYGAKNKTLFTLLGLK